MNRIQGEHLTRIEMEDELAIRPGLIPTAIEDGRIVWLDLEQYHCYEGFFEDALTSFASIRGRSPDSFTSEFDVLDSIRIPANSLAPTGFIFHAGRCGSTMLVQVLARSRANMVFGEAAPHNQIWLQSLSASGGAKPEATTYRNLFFAMGRRRLDSYCSHIVKFTSYNIVQFERIRIAFPGVPALFLFREPAAMLDSYRRANLSWMVGRELGIGRTLASPETTVEAFFRAALSTHDPDFRCLDYARLTPESLASIIKFFRVDPDPGELRLMVEGFSWDARRGRIPCLFVPRCRSSASASAAVGVPETLQELYTRLTRWKPLLD